jgi:tetratricopeptide (TPR) repeat protein
MKPLIFILLTAVVSAAFIHINSPSSKTDFALARQKIDTYKKQFAFGCTPNLASFNLDDSANIIPLLNGWGNYRMPVTATHDSAAIYFEQGINMYYGFHIIEALASFDKATKFDSNFAMGHWGKALSYGPNINDLGYSASPDALTAVQKAKELGSNCTPVEKALIDAMTVRYSVDTMQTRQHLNQLYADAMKKVHAQFPESGDAAALYADALMVQHPWDYYDKDYKPKPWTPEIVSILEDIVKKFPDHPGASHYYIHAIEASEHPEKGLAVANRLGGMMPGVSHLVHMPSHIYIRSGYYKEGIESNKSAVKEFNNYLDKYPPVSAELPYNVHNLHMQATCANMEGRFNDALKISNDCKNTINAAWLDSGGYFSISEQYIYMTFYFTLIRFGKWDEILNARPVTDKRIYANIIWHYGKGIAFARKHEIDKASLELDTLRAKMMNAQLKEHPPAFNPGIASIEVAEKILEGVIAEENNDLNGAINSLKEAVNREDNMLYLEPRDWPHPARQYLGNALLKAHQYSEAEKTYREDLKINPNNGWSLTGLANALTKQEKKPEAQKTSQAVKKSFARSDINITSSVF